MTSKGIRRDEYPKMFVLVIVLWMGVGFVWILGGLVIPFVPFFR